MLVVAALNEFVDRELSVFQQIGINPSGIDTVFSSIQHAFKNSIADNEDITTAFLDIEADHTMLSIIKENTLLFSREIMPGGNDFTRAIMDPFTIGKEHFALNFAEAEEIKITYGIPRAGDHGKTPQGIPVSRIMFMIRPVLEMVITETLRSFDFFKAQTNEKSIDRIFLCSGGAGLKNLPESLSSGLGIEVNIFNPFENIIIPPEIKSDENFLQNKHRLSVAVGVSTGKARDFNFLPQQPGILEKESLKKWIPVFAAVIFIFALFTYYSSLKKSVGVCQKELEYRKTELQSINVSLEGLSNLAEKKDSLMEQLAGFDDFSVVQPPFSDIFVCLTRIFPDCVSLKNIVMERGGAYAHGGLSGRTDINLKLEGIAAGRDYDVVGLLARISAELEKSPFFYNVIIDTSEKTSASGENGIRFILNCPLEPDCFI